MDPNAAHIIGFALEVSLEEVDYLIQVARAQQSLASVERLREYREALAAIRAEFSATSENLQGIIRRIMAASRAASDRSV